MKMYTIYHDTSDYPGVYCVREWLINREPEPGALLGTAKDLKAARELVPPGRYLMHRSNMDDPKIIETWI